MDFLLVALLMLWSFGACFLPVREKALRSLATANALLVTLALVALAVPAFSGASTSVLSGLFIMDDLRALIAIPVAICWLISMVAFVLWWGVSFKNGTGTRPLFCLRSMTLVGAFGGILLVLFTDSLPIMLGGLLLTFFMASVGVLFQISDSILKHVRVFALGCGAALVAFAVGTALLLISGFQQAGKLLITHTDVVTQSMSSTNTLAMLGIAITGFSVLWFMGLLPGLAWYRKGMASLPKGQRLMMRVLLPAALFPHVLTLAAWGGEAGGFFVQKMFLVASFFAALTLIEYLHARESVSDTVVILLLGMSLVSLAYGPAGAIPALMMVMMLVLLGTLMLIAHGGVWWNLRIRVYVGAIFGAVPFVSPLFVPYGLSIGYGIHIMPAVACIATVLLVYTSYTLAVRVYRSWSEIEATYADRWSAHLGVLLLGVMTLYGCWFMYADALALVVKSVGA